MREFSKKNEFYSPVSNIHSEEESFLKEIEKKDRELSAAQECIEIIHEKLRRILVKKLAEIVKKQLGYCKWRAFEKIKIYYC